MHCIVSGISDLNKQRVTNYVESCGAKIKFYTNENAALNNLKVISEWSTAVYYRLLFPHILPSNIETLLYLDTDTIIVGKIDQIFNLSLDMFPIGAVYDNYVRLQSEIGINEEGKYFNSGMMLLNLTLWREKNYTELVCKYIHTFPERIKFVDQCGLNAVLAGQWLHLDEKYNYLTSYIPQGLSKKDLRSLLADKVIIHFTLKRPWIFPSDHPLRYLYRKYHKKSLVRGHRIYGCVSLLKLPDYFKILLLELYFSSKFLKTIWRGFKSISLR